MNLLQGLKRNGTQEPVIMGDQNHHPEAAAFLSKHHEIADENRALRHDVQDKAAHLDMQARRIEYLEGELARTNVELKIFQACFFKMQAELTVLATSGAAIAQSFREQCQTSIDAAHETMRRAGLEAKEAVKPRDLDDERRLQQLAQSLAPADPDLAEVEPR